MGKKRQAASELQSAAFDDLPFQESIGYQLRMANRATQRYLQTQIEPHGVTLGMWYFLRALWQEDGLTQRELSHRIGTMEPTTLSALTAMERSGFITRERGEADRRKLNVKLTEKGRALKKVLMPCAHEVINRATAGLNDSDRCQFIRFLIAVQDNLCNMSE